METIGTPANLDAVAANLFPAARRILKDRQHFPWHRDIDGNITAALAKSSQALAIDLFWTVRNLQSRDKILNSWCRTLGLPFVGPWEIDLEHAVDSQLLREPRVTQLDAIARSPNGNLLFECKFTEPDGGSCSQTKPLGGRGSNARLIQCNGKYEPQLNPVNGKTSSCALTGKGIRYWDVVPEVLRIDPSARYAPCPFAGGWYQWMRNLVVAAELARISGLPTAVVVVFTDGPFSMAQKIAAAKSGSENDWSRFTALASSGVVPLDTISYQALIQDAQRSADNDEHAILRDLAEWVGRKIAYVSAS